MSNLESKYTLFDSVEEMLAPETLSHLLSKPVTHVDCHPFEDHGGVAGSRLSYVNTNIGRFVLKLMSSEFDWIMLSSGDQQCRAVRLWQYGLLDQLRPYMEHKILACAHHHGAWAILMDDIGENVFKGNKQMTPELISTFLDALARLHATFWNTPYLRDPRLGLCNEAQMLAMSTPPMTQKYQHLSMGWVPKAIREGNEILEKQFLDLDVFTYVQDLIENPQSLMDALSRYPYTLLHGDYRIANLAHQEPEQSVVFDWQIATCSLMTIDLAWFITEMNGDARDGLSPEKARNLYRERLETHLNIRFDDAIWQAMVELGALVHALRSIYIQASLYKNAESPDQQAFWKIELNKCIQQIRDAIRWL